MQQLENRPRESFSQQSPHERQFAPYLLKRPKDAVASNRDEALPIIYINGMNMTEDSIRNSASELGRTYARDVFVIPNDKESNLALDLTNVAASLFSSKAGQWAEPDASTHLTGVLRARLHDDAPVYIYAYSQGSLIAKDALWEIHDSLIKAGEKKRWDHFAARVQLTTAAAVTRSYPPGIAALENKHSADPAALLSSSSALLHSLAGYDKELNKPDIAQIDNDKSNLLETIQQAHSVDEYLAHTAEFYLKRIEHFDANTQARMILASMRTSEFSDAVYPQILAHLSAPAGQETPGHAEALRAKEVSSLLLEGIERKGTEKLQLPAESLRNLQQASIMQLPSPPKASEGVIGWISKQWHSLSGRYTRGQ